MRIRFLGTGDAFASGGRFQTCMLLESGDVRCLLDCGATSLVALKRAGVDPYAIGTILITHLHGDHFGGLPFLILDGQLGGRSMPLVLAGPPALSGRLATAMEAFYPGTSRKPRPFTIDYRELTDGTLATIGRLRVTAYEVVHSGGGPPLALRVELDGRTVAYSGDTKWTGRLVDAAKGADLFVCESSSYEQAGGSHLDYRTIVAHRSELGCGRLVLTHMGVDMLARTDEVPIECAYDGLEIDL